MKVTVKISGYCQLRWGRRARLSSVAMAGLCASSVAITAVAQDPPPSGAPQDPAAQAPAAAPAAAADIQKISLLMVREINDRPPPLSLLEIPPADDGMAGAKLAISDNNTTGKFLKQQFSLDTLESGNPDDIVAEVTKRVDAGTPYVIADVEPGTLLKIADALKGKTAVVFNVGTPDDTVREEDCRPNVLHTSPSRSMVADALAQYMAWKRWRNWFLILGPEPQDKALADAFRRSAKRFGLKIVEEREFKYDPGSRRSDGGFEQIQQQIPSFTQNAVPHDVVVVADEAKLFGDYLPYRTWDARPVIGSAGLYATSWHPAVELWGGTQFQNRFKRMANRAMRPLDYNAWMAVRSVGEAATRKRTGDPAELVPYFKAKEFELAAFKGQKLTYREWNGQLRQPVLLATSAIHVTVSPQPGFLHQFTELDTLGVDRPESRCKLSPS